MGDIFVDSLFDSGESAAYFDWRGRFISLELQHDDRPLTLRGYRGWRAAQDDPAAWPSVDAFRGGGSWLAWCTRAKVATATRRRRCRHPNKAILEVLVAAGDGSGQVGTSRYEKYRLAHPGAPSRATIISRYGSWAAAETAAAVMNNEATVDHSQDERLPPGPVTAPSISRVLAAGGFTRSEITPAVKRGRTVVTEAVLNVAGFSCRRYWPVPPPSRRWW